MPKKYLGNIEDLLTELSKDGFSGFQKFYSKYDIFVGDIESVSLIRLVLKSGKINKSREKKITAFLLKNYRKFKSIEKAYEAALVD